MNWKAYGSLVTSSSSQQLCELKRAQCESARLSPESWR